MDSSCQALDQISHQNCVTCSRFTCTEPFLLMGDLPLERISAVREKLRLSVRLYLYKSMSFRGRDISTRRSVSSSN